MGGNVSDAKTISDEIWNRELSEMFISSKMTEPFEFNPKFLIPINYFDQEKMFQSYIFITKDGNIYSLSYILPDIEFNITLKCSTLIFCIQIDDLTFGLIDSNGKIFILTYNKTDFIIKEFEISKSKEIIVYNKENLIIICNDLSVYLIKNNNEIKNIWESQIEDRKSVV